MTSERHNVHVTTMADVSRRVTVENDAEASLGLFEGGRDRVAGHRRPRGRAAAAVRVPVVRRVLVAVAVGLVARQPISWMLLLVVVMVVLLLVRQRHRRQRVMMVWLLVVMLLVVMTRQCIRVRNAGDRRSTDAAVVVVERAVTARRLPIVVLVVHRADAAPHANVHRVEIVRVRRASTALRQRHAFLVAEQLSFQTVVFSLQGSDLAPVTEKEHPLNGILYPKRLSYLYCNNTRHII